MDRRLLLVCLVLASCTGTSEPGRIVVLAAASLTGVLGEIEASFEASSAVDVTIAYGPSNGLALQIGEGARADVFASASPLPMDSVADDVGLRRRAVLATNRLVMITPPEGPVRRVQDLAQHGVKLVIAARGVPAGDYARDALLRIEPAALGNVVSNEIDVRGVVQKVLLGEADAGIVYATDAIRVKERVRVLPMPGSTAEYQIGIPASALDPASADAFVTFVLDHGGPALRRSGFVLP